MHVSTPPHPDPGRRRVAGVAVQGCGAADGRERAAAPVGDLDRLAGRGGGIEMASGPIVGP